MSRPFQIEIKERQEELEKALRHVTQASSIRLITNALLAQEWSSEQQAIAISERLGRSGSNHNSLGEKV